MIICGIHRCIAIPLSSKGNGLCQGPEKRVTFSFNLCCRIAALQVLKCLHVLHPMLVGMSSTLCNMLPKFAIRLVICATTLHNLHYAAMLRDKLKKRKCCPYYRAFTFGFRSLIPIASEGRNILMAIAKTCVTYKTKLNESVLGS